MDVAADPIAKALAYVEAGLGRPLTLAEVAAHVGYSPFHFHRLFLAVTGETLGAYIRKRRLAEAARLLAGGQGSVLDIALELGSSQEALTRSFRRATGFTPGAYRRAWRVGQACPMVAGAAAMAGLARSPKPGTGGLAVEAKMEPKFVEKGKMSVVGMVYYGENKQGEIGRLWERFNPAASAIKNVVAGSMGYGVCFNDNRTADPNFCYLACLEVADLTDIPVNMVGKTVPASTYAVFTVAGLAVLHEAYRYIYQTWLPASGYELSGSYDFEAYGEEFDSSDASGQLYIYIPVKKRAA